jgi:pyridoxamine 5'-phosphate oxidase
MKDFIIDPENVEEDPFLQFRLWYEEYLKTNPKEPAAMFLATADGRGAPSGRVVLMKAFDQEGVVFYTNYESRKGRDLAANAMASLTFYWTELNRQVRITGAVKKVSPRESDEYFASRAFESRLAAVASRQDEVLESREELLNKMSHYRKLYEASGQVPRPAHWGGYRVIPERMEFWQGRENRAHDRVEYFLEKKKWKRQRLSP